jgi:hypothetical protein
MEVISSLCIKMMHIFFIKIIQRSLTRKYKDQIEATSLTTDIAKPTNLMKGVAMSGPILGPHTYAHHQIIGGLTKAPNSELEAQTSLARQLLWYL